MCGKKRRTKGSVVQELCHFVILSIMTDSTYFVKSTSLGAFSVSFLIFCRHVTDIQKMCTKDFKAKKKLTNLQMFSLSQFHYCTNCFKYWLHDSAYFVKSTPLRAFSVSFQYFVDTLQTY